MKMFMYLIFFSFTFCKSKKETSTDCDLLNQKYMDSRVENKKDSAIYYLDKVILCSKNDEFYVTEKVKYFIFLGELNNALKFVTDSNKTNKSLSLSIIEGVIRLKISNDNKYLLSVYDEYKNEAKKNDFNVLFYKIALDNFFEGKEKSILEINKIENNYSKDSYESSNLKMLKDIISNNKKEEVLFILFNIKEGNVPN